jgi:hypothetical protein
MKTLHFRQRSGGNGNLAINVSVRKADTECDVVVVVDPTEKPVGKANRWTRPSQGTYETQDGLA